MGETGGGMANAIVGSAKLLLLATCIGVPIGFLGGVYLAEFGGSDVLLRDALHHGLAEWRAVDRDRNFRVHAHGAAARSISRRWPGGIALGVMMIPIAIRSSEEFLRAVPVALREGAMALGASKWPRRFSRW